MADPRSTPPSSVRPSPPQTDLAPLLIYSGVLLAAWSIWAVALFPLAQELSQEHPTLMGLFARLVFWGLPSAIYLHHFWGRRALEPLGLTFPLGTQQKVRTALISTVAAFALVAGTAAQAGQPISVLMQRLVAAPSSDWMAPVMEELVFRGIVVAELLNWTHDSSRSGVQLRLRFWGGQLGAALLFVAVHWPFWVSHLGAAQAVTLSPSVLVTGLILGFVFAATRSIWGCIFLHWLNNALSQIT